MILQARRWLPARPIVVVADSAYAVLELLARCCRLTRPVTVVTRLRLAALYDPAPPRTAQTKGRPRRKGKRQPTLERRLTDPGTPRERLAVHWYGGGERTIEVATGVAVWYRVGMSTVPLRWVLIRDPEGRFEPQASLCTDQTAAAKQIVEWFVLRWQVEVTFHKARTYLGVETQRQWSDRAFLWTTPALWGLVSLVALAARRFLGADLLPTRQAAWCAKGLPTFADTLALVRRQLWPVAIPETSPSTADAVQIPLALPKRFTHTLAFVARRDKV